MHSLNKFMNFAIVVLAIGALALGAILVSQRGVKFSNFFKSASNSATSSNSDVLNSPKADAPKSDFERYNALVESQAKDSELLSLGSNCKSDPVVLHVKPDLLAINIKNNDSASHTINFNKDNLYKLAPGETKSFKLAQIAPNVVSGAFPYGCDVSYPTGVLWFKF